MIAGSLPGPSRKAMAAARQIWARIEANRFAGRCTDPALCIAQALERYAEAQGDTQDDYLPPGRPTVTPRGLASFLGAPDHQARDLLRSLLTAGGIERVRIGHYAAVWTTLPPWLPFGSGLAAAFGVDR